MLKMIKPFYSTKNVCIENIYTSICRALNRNEKNIYAYSWDIGYNPFCETFSEKIKTSRDGQTINPNQDYALEHYCGIKPIWHMNVNVEHFIEIVRQELAANRPVGLGIDIYACDWHIFFEKYHFLHFCLIIGMDEQGFICIDDTLASNDGVLRSVNRPDYVKIKFDTFWKYYMCYVTYDIQPTIKNFSADKMIYLSALKTLTGCNGISDFDQLRNLQSDFNVFFDIEKEIAGVKDSRSIRILRTFSSIAWSRNNYCQFLADKQSTSRLDIKQICNTMLEATTLWEEISYFILKYAVSERLEIFDYKVIGNHLNKIIKIEENLAKYIVESYELNQLESMHKLVK